MIEENGAQDDAEAQVAARIVKLRAVRAAGGDGRMEIAAEQFQFGDTLGQGVLNYHRRSGGFAVIIAGKSGCGDREDDQKWKQAARGHGGEASGDTPRKEREKISETEVSRMEDCLEISRNAAAHHP